MARTASGKASMKTRTGEDCEAQLMRACDFDTLQMEQAEFLMTTIMDARAKQDAFEDLDERGMQCPSTEGKDEDGVCLPVSESVEEVAALSSPEEDSTVSTPAMAVASPSTALPVPSLTLSILEVDEDRQVQWNPLISPLREEDEVVEETELSSPEPPVSRVFFNQDGGDDREGDEKGDATSIAEPDSELGMEERLRELVESENAKALQAKLSRGTLGEYGGDEDFTVDAGMDEDDEEFEVYNAYTLVKEETGCSEELFEEKLDSTGTEEDDNEDCTDETRTSVATTLDDSCEESPRASSSAAASRLGRRFRANTYTGAASTYVRNGCAMIRSRTLSSTSSFRNSSQPSTNEIEADVDFSSDDEGYSRDRVSGTSGGGGRYSLRSRLSSVGGSFRVSANLKLLRFRTSSATTTTSEDSFCNDSRYANSPRSTGEVHSAPPSFSGAEASQQEQQPSNQMQGLKLKASACASKAAGYLNAASAEAARKLKSKTFRSAKPVASETDVDADPLPSPPSSVLSTMAHD